jgi:hypothetical protein
MDKTIREDSESGDPKQGDADLTIREEVQATDATLVEGASTVPFLSPVLSPLPALCFPIYF